MFPTPDATRGPAAHGSLPLPTAQTATQATDTASPARPAHLLLPFAVLAPSGGFSGAEDAAGHGGAATAPAVAPAAPPPVPHLPNLQRLLARATRISHASHPQRHGDAALSLSPPHEWALAQALCLWPAPAGPDPMAPLDHLAHDGQLPWAAWACPALLATPSTPAAWFTPCHQEVGTGQVTLHPPNQLALSDAHSQALMAALQPWAAEDGIALTWVAADRWLAQGAAFAHLSAASMDRVAGRSIAPWVDTDPVSAGLRRLQSEAQMLFYTHPAHDERVAQRLAPVNAMWVSGAGVCPPSARRHAPECAVDTTLRAAALHHGPSAWQQAWQALDAQVLPAWLAHAEQGHPVAITLCGERGSATLHLSPQSLGQSLRQKITSFLSPSRLIHIISSL